MLGISDAVGLTRIINDLVDTGTTTELHERIAELRKAVLNANDEIVALMAEVQALKTKELETQSWEETAAKYLLVEIPGGKLVLKTALLPAQYVCPNCFIDQRVCLLRSSNAPRGEYACPGCRKTFTIGAPKPRNLHYPSSRSGGGPDSGWTPRE